MRVDESEIDWQDSGDRAYRQGKPYTGEVVEKKRDGRITSVTSYLDGVEHGQGQSWHANGRLSAEWHVDHGKPVGLYRTWYADGTPAEERHFSDDGKLLLHRKWDEQGVVVKDKSYGRA
ncbi:hypothetical protein AB0K14_09160 [Actinosynnema sp. NPDC050801]|uniref:toxin-antitoxin system YwqK family antitoxin n=1 Tax=unclassified Actinosynnema TaxID=2637065 RepID=UPI0033E4DEC1